MGSIITTRRLTLRYHPSPGPPAIDEVDLDIREGEIFGLLGPNGAGKTTLIAVLCGLLPPTAGDATIAGHSVARDPMAVKRAIGVVPEEIALYARLSGRQNLRFFGSLRGLAGREMDRAVDEALAEIALTDRAGDKVADYSNGMKRRLNIAVELLHKPRILLMDEPTLGLDPESRRHILDLVTRFKRERGATILYTTHNMEEAQELSDRVGIIHRGRIIAQGAPGELIQAMRSEDTLRLDIGASAVSAAALSALSRVPEARLISSDNQILLFSLRSAAEALPEILAIVKEAGIGVRALTVQQPSLETVFLRLTGERLTEAP
jgi:ABC-2 type transport system ATP-binding protein